MVLHRQTAAFVARFPVQVELERRVTVDDGEGGRTSALQPPLPPVTVTLCEPGSSGYGPPLAAADGTRRAVDFLLVAQPDVDVQAGDEFTVVPYRYRVDNVLPANGWETRAYVVKVGAA